MEIKEALRPRLGWRIHKGKRFGLGPFKIGAIFRAGPFQGGALQPDEALQAGAFRDKEALRPGLMGWKGGALRFRSPAFAERKRFGLESFQNLGRHFEPSRSKGKRFGI